jgi:diaminopimelate decarboxylase
MKPSEINPHSFPHHSFYLYDKKIFLQCLEEFDQAFRKRYSNTRLALSVKTNYLCKLLQDAASTNCLFEVVSLAEYHYVRSLGLEPARIIVNGPVKGETLIQLSLIEGALLQIDSMDELAPIQQTSLNHPSRPMRVGLRCSFTLPNETPSRFGFDPLEPGLLQTYLALKKIPNLQIENLHCHYCSARRQASDYRDMTSFIIQVASSLPDFDPISLNLGGGFLSPADLSFQKQFPFPWVSFDQYADAITSVLNKHYTEKKSPQLILEPGMAVDAGCMSFFAKVSGIKKIKNRTLVQVYGSSYNIKPNKSNRNLPATLLPQGQGSRTMVENAEIVGYTCMENDVLHHGFSGEIAAGDYIRFDQVGAYGITLKPPFIEPLPPVYEKNDDAGTLTLIQAEETWPEMFGQARVR